MEHRINPFRKAGLVLLTIGIIDIGVMAYCIANEMSYSSSFNIFAVIAGIFLMKGGVKTARVVRWFSAFAVVAFIGLILVIPFITPISLLVTQIKLNALSMLGSFIFGLVLIGVLVWVHIQLSTPESLKLLANEGYKTDKPKSAYIAGAALLILAVGISVVFLNGESAQKAKSLAQTQLGTEYQYHVSSMSISGNSGHASVIAYNRMEVRSVEVRW
ncbi:MULTISPECIES: hypothetical protein [unclassified Ketobacter]|uniref:hypothetical protein n=1 Tax=unclassified Ketobacter TaxID=2639109 RepID=UPI000F18AA6D|nr:MULTISPECIES: hypothetical protein [unclassified Ketobacter]RLT89443.1 MAG: hypothetical protein D9N13_14020 [Ketobacter sp. GenoA1]RLT95942.1 MAG: hypothetical protein D9N15_12830 [Ketobacter sp.]